MGTTAHGYPYPETTDSPDGPAQMRALAEAIDTQAGTVADPPRIGVKLPSGSTPLIGVAGTPVPWTSVFSKGGITIVNAGGFSNAGLKVPIAGLYEYKFSVTIMGPSSGFWAIHDLGITKAPGTTVTWGDEDMKLNRAEGLWWWKGSYDLELAANDIVSSRIRTNNTTSIHIVSEGTSPVGTIVFPPRTFASLVYRAPLAGATPAYLLPVPA